MVLAIVNAVALQLLSCYGVLGMYVIEINCAECGAKATEREPELPP